MSDTTDLAVIAQDDQLGSTTAVEPAARGERGRTPKAVTGTLHMGKIDAEQRARRAAKNARTRSHSGEGTRKACNEYPGCNHRKHGRKS